MVPVLGQSLGPVLYRRVTSDVRVVDSTNTTLSNGTNDIFGSFQEPRGELGTWTTKDDSGYGRKTSPTYPFRLSRRRIQLKPRNLYRFLVPGSTVVDYRLPFNVILEPEG